MFSEDLNVFFDVAGHAENVTYTPSAGLAVTIKIIWEEEFAAISDGEAGFEAYAPSVLVKASDITGTPYQAKIVRDSKSYFVREVRKMADGNILQLILDEE